MPRRRNECHGSTDEHLYIYTAVGGQEDVKKINEELEILERECTSAQSRTQEYLDRKAHKESSGSFGRSSGESAEEA